eukprot:jgi/Picre1/31101/NNA_006456.t1
MMKNALRSTGGRNAEMMLGRRISSRGSGQQRYRVQAFNSILGGNLLSMADVSTKIGDAAPSEVLDAGLDIGTGVPDPSPVVDVQSQFASVGITEALSNMNLEDMLSDIVDLVPFEPLQGFVSMVGHDVIGLVTLHPSVLGVLRLMGDRLGNGNYGQVYEGLRMAKSGVPDLKTPELTQEQKSRRVVLKKTNLDAAGIRSNFLSSGTMARGAAETGAVEDYMCRRISVHPIVKRYCAEYLGNFIAETYQGNFTAGSQVVDLEI